MKVPRNTYLVHHLVPQTTYGKYYSSWDNKTWRQGGGGLRLLLLLGDMSLLKRVA